MLVSDDEDIPKYTVYEDNKLELEMIGVVDESKIVRS